MPFSRGVIVWRLLFRDIIQCLPLDHYNTPTYPWSKFYLWHCDRHQVQVQISCYYYWPNNTEPCSLRQQLPIDTDQLNIYLIKGFVIRYYSEHSSLLMWNSSSWKQIIEISDRKLIEKVNNEVLVSRFLSRIKAATAYSQIKTEINL